jgi:membrane fusion protein (multidrug efflux system)
MSDAANTTANGNGARNRWLTILTAVVAVCALLYGLYWLFYARYFQDTSDAYVSGDIVVITSREPGTVLSLYADNTQAVKRGQPLIELDPIKARVAEDAAVADLARTVRAVRAEFSKVDELRAELASAHVTLERAQSDYHRRMTAGDSVSHEELAHANDAVTSARNDVDQTQGKLQQALASVQGTSVSDNPDVLAAMARLRQASIVLAHMRLYAPVGGVVAQRSVQLGQQIAPGTPLMAVVPLDSVWIDANFKEAQLRNMRVGQPVTVNADLYGGSVTYHGKIIGLGAGTGSAFALLPPQNASGNWIKIVQRLPVRIALDPKDLSEHPLRVGLSVDVSVDISDTSGSVIGSTTAERQMRGDTGDDGSAEADRLIARILKQHGA